MAMKPYYEHTGVTLHCGDCLEVMRGMPDCSVDAVICDPPYGLEFMGKEWDKLGTGDKRRIVVPEAAMGYQDGNGGNAHSRSAVRFTGGPTGARAMQDWHTEWAIAALRVLKPGGHLLAFGGTRTFHRLAVAIEDAGWEIRDTISWLYGQGFPKSLDVSKAIDRRGGNAQMAAEIGAALKQAREARGIEPTEADRLFCDGTTNYSWFEGRPTGQRAPTTATFARIVAAWPEMQRYADAVATIEREVTGVSPYYSAGRKADNMSAGGEGGTGQRDRSITAPATDAAKAWQGWGTALKPAWEPIIVARKPLVGTVAANVQRYGTGAINVDGCRIEGVPWKAHDATGLAAEKFFTRGETPVIHKEPHAQGRWPPNVAMDSEVAGELDAVAGPRQAGNMPANRNGSFFGQGGTTHGEHSRLNSGGASRFFYVAKASGIERGEGNSHPCVKPVALMRYLCRLVTPPGGVVLDPFTGSGTTGCAAVAEGFAFIGIEQSADYCAIAARRLAACQRQSVLPLEVSA